ALIPSASSGILNVKPDGMEIPLTLPAPFKTMNCITLFGVACRITVPGKRISLPLTVMLVFTPVGDCITNIEGGALEQVETSLVVSLKDCINVRVLEVIIGKVSI